MRMIQQWKNMAYTSVFVLNIWLLVGVFGPQTGGAEMLSVMEGDSVTLHTGRTEILTDDHILWILWLNSSNICIAEMFKQVITFPDGNEIFQDRLKMDYKTGSLSITNITTEHNGLYELIIARDSKASNMIFIVNVYASERPSSSLSPNCVLLCSAVNIECLDDSYSCVLNNPITNQTQLLNSTELCQPCPEHVHCCDFTEAVIRLVFSAGVGMATVAIVVYDITSRRIQHKLKENMII